MKSKRSCALRWSRHKRTAEEQRARIRAVLTMEVSHMKTINVETPYAKKQREEKEKSCQRLRMKILAEIACKQKQVKKGT